MLARKKSSRFIYNKFTSNLKILALLLMMWKITLEVKFDEKFPYKEKVHGLLQLPVLLFSLIALILVFIRAI